MKKTSMKLTTAPGSKIGSYWLFRVLPNWARFAEELEEILQFPSNSTLVIQWDLVYNWAPDDDPESECTPQYQPTLFGRVSIVDASTMWERARSPLVVVFDHEDWLFYKPESNVPARELRTPQRIAEDLLVKGCWLYS